MFMFLCCASPRYGWARAEIVAKIKKKRGQVAKGSTFCSFGCCFYGAVLLEDEL